MATAQDTPGTPGREDTGPGLSSDESFGGALVTGSAAPEDPWARVAEQLEWEQRRGTPAAELPTKPSLPEAPAHYGKWREQALARGLRSVFVTAADDFSSAPPRSPGLELLAAPPEITAAPVGAAVAGVAPVPVPVPVVVPSPATADRPRVELSPPSSPAAASGAGRHPAAESATPAATAVQPQPRPVRRSGGLLGAVQRPVLSPPEKPPAPAAAASAPPPSPAGLRALAAGADQAVRQSVRRGKTLLRRLLRADPGAPPPRPPGSD